MCIRDRSNSTRKKVNAALFIDGENISSKKAEQIQKIANKQGVLVVSYTHLDVYKRQAGEYH